MLKPTPHYFVITIGTIGDVYPFMRIAGALQSLGCKVTFISHSYHRHMVESAGLSFIGLGTDEEYLRLLANPDLWHAKKAFSALLANLRELLDQIDAAIAAVAAGPDAVVIAHPFAVPGAVLSRERGYVKSIVAAYLAPSNLRTIHDPLTIGPTAVPPWVPMSWRRALWRFVEKGWVNPVAVAQINAAREGKGLSKVDSLFTHIAEAPDLSVALFPSWFAPPVPDWPRPMVMSDFPLAAAAAQDGLGSELAAFLARGERPLVFTAGTGNLHAADFFTRALAAVNKLGRRAIFLTRERAQVPPDLPGLVLWQPYVPLSALLPHAAALVHHGGIGTTAEALRCGTPQLIAPFAWDQFDNAARVVALGVGMSTLATRLRAGKLARDLAALTGSEAIRARCAQHATRFAAPHNTTALCQEIERILLAGPDNAGYVDTSAPGQAAQEHAVLGTLA